MQEASQGSGAGHLCMYSGVLACDRVLGFAGDLGAWGRPPILVRLTGTCRDCTDAMRPSSETVGCLFAPDGFYSWGAADVEAREADQARRKSRKMEDLLEAPNQLFSRRIGMPLKRAIRPSLLLGSTKTHFLGASGKAITRHALFPSVVKSQLLTRDLDSDTIRNKTPDRWQVSSMPPFSILLTPTDHADTSCELK